MSRYTEVLLDGRTLAWGCDTAGFINRQHEYFVHLYMSEQEIKTAEKEFGDDFDECIWAIASINTLKPMTEGKLEHSNLEILKIMGRYNSVIPVGHRLAVAANDVF